MLTPEQDKAVALTVMNLRIILLMLIVSVSAFLIFIVVRLPRGEEGSNLRTIGLVAAAIAVVAAVAVPMKMARQQGRPSAANGVDPATPLLAGFQARSIVRGAILEGVAMLNAFVYMQERQPESLVAAIVLLLGVAVTIPFKARTAEWLERELRLQRDARDLQA